MRFIERESVQARGENFASIQVIGQRNVSEIADDFRVLFDDPSDGPACQFLIDRIVAPEMLPSIACSCTKAIARDQTRDLLVVIERSFANFWRTLQAGVRRRRLRLQL